MKYAELIDSGASPTEIQSYLVDSELVPVTIRIPRNLRDSAKEAASLSGLATTRQSAVSALMVWSAAQRLCPLISRNFPFAMG